MAGKIKRGCLIPLLIGLLLFAGLILLSLTARATAPGWPMRVEGVRLEPLLPPLDALDITKENGAWYLMNPTVNYDLSEAEDDEAKSIELAGDWRSCTNMLAWMEANPDWLAPLRGCSAAAHHQVPTVSNIQTSVGYVMSKQDINRRLRLWMDMKAAAHDWEAVEEAMTISLDLGHTVSSGGTLINHLVGGLSVFETTGSMQHFRETEELSPSVAKAWQELLHRHRARSQPLAETFRYERLFAQDAVQLAYGQGIGAAFGGGGPNLPYLSPLMMLFGSSPKKTAAHFDDLYSHLIHEAGLPVYSNHADKVVEDFFSNPTYLTYLSPDPMGRILGGLLLPTLQSSRISEAKVQLNVDLTDVALGIERWTAEQDELPEHLADLVPEYLVAVPVDPFDPAGGLIRYVSSNESWRIYSVWNDFKDDGGEVHFQMPGMRRVKEGADYILFSDHDARAKALREKKAAE
ncbi:MAG: hypothetical protein ACI97B_000554 [Verrucomicrobiales bacterium]|jgi:hypothetical protein